MRWQCRRMTAAQAHQGELLLFCTMRYGGTDKVRAMRALIHYTRISCALASLQISVGFWVTVCTSTLGVDTQQATDQGVQATCHELAKEKAGWS